MLLRNALLAAVLTTGCGSAPPPAQPSETSPKGPTAQFCDGPASAEDRVSLAAALRERHVRPAEPVTAGQMTEEAAAAKRLFDSERWADARKLLRRVADGTTGDDAGNRQIAEYFVAVTYTRTAEVDRAVDAFGGIATRPSHLKHQESLLWLLRLDSQRPRGVPAGYFANFPNHALLHGRAHPDFTASAMRVGRGKLWLGDYRAASELFDAVPATEPGVERCRTLARSEQGQIALEPPPT